MSNLLTFAFDKIKSKIEDDCIEENIGTSERVLSVIAGGFILGMGVKKLFKSPLTGFSGLTLGGALIYRGVTGHCDVKKALEGNDVKKVEVIEHRYFVK
ncbi:YgaP family membrane protein [Sphingobacterium thalpophilum]|uniref:DUF2892 domain-containing protein n=1 Tax=Sphingobacterium thalpophilum TaxID=259 RepID=A0A4V6KVG3_9SPHI|nr:MULTISPECIES: DUF2892 domain-containing protein [Sphingobacterium]MCW8311823.1 DUF2892 domain-containing protein [Sphingobacterium sp. InxBP1]VTR52498.1 Protein of uncharacterised function (DUF2892) [Sphingobacterium thalpophilum]